MPSIVTSIDRAGRAKGVSYSSLPRTLLEGCEYKSLTDVMQSGRQRSQVELLEGSHDSVHITPSILFLDKPVRLFHQILVGDTIHEIQE